MRPTVTSLPPAAAPSARRTNATILHRGTRAVAPQSAGVPAWWDYWSGVERLGAEVAAGVVLLGAAWMHARGYGALVTAAALVVACAALVCVGWCATGALLTRRHRREVLDPFARAVGPLVGRHEGEPARRYLEVPADFGAGVAPAVVHLHRGFRAVEGELRMVEQVAAHHLPAPAGELSFSWHEAAGRRPRLVVRPKHRPPDTWRYSDPEVQRVVARQPEQAPVVGATGEGQTFAVSLDDEAPHFLVSAAPGGGKSVMLKAIAAPTLAYGATATILDLKRGSHPWARGLPAVDYCRDLATMHGALVELGAELERRTAVLDALGDDDDEALAFRRHLVLVEESNATLARLDRWWERNRGRGDPKRSPAVEALGELLFMGRQLRMNVLMVAQSATARALGGPEVRECFSVRFLSRYSRQAWGMLAGDVLPMPPSSRHPGRWQVVLGGEARALQALYLTDPEAHELAARGGTVAPLGAQVARGPEVGRLRLVGEGGLVTLSQAVEAGGVLAGLSSTPERSLAIARRQSTRDPEFPARAGWRGDAGVWPPELLDRWARNRPRAELAAVEGEL